MSAPLVVNTKDGVCWTRRTVTSGGIALYAPERVKTCPGFVMATLEELAEQGIVGSAFALPVPVGPEPEPQKPGTFRFTLDIEGATDREDASWAAEQAVSAVEGQGYKASAGMAAEDAHYRAAFEAQQSRAETLDRLLRTAQDRVAELESERHTTNEALSDAAEQLRVDRDRIAELEARLAEQDKDRPGMRHAVRTEDAAPAENGCPRNVIDGDMGAHLFRKGALSDSPIACSYCGAKKPESGDAR